MNTLHSDVIRFKTHACRNALTGGKAVYHATPVNVQTKGIRDTAADMVALGCNVDQTTICYVLDFLTANLPEMIARDGGCRRTLGNFISIFPVISGSFPEPGSAFDPARNKLTLAVTALKGLRDGIAGASAYNVTQTEIRPAILQETLYTVPGRVTGRVNAVGTGLASHVKCRDVVFVPGRGDEGVWLEGGKLAEPVRMRVTMAEPTFFDFMPDAPLPAGTLTLKVCTRAGRDADDDLYTMTRRVKVVRA